VEVSPEVLASRVTDVSQRGWFKRPDGTMDPLWLALKERCGKKLKVRSNVQSKTGSLGNMILPDKASEGGWESGVTCGTLVGQT
jgi:hypothetical protein